MYCLSDIFPTKLGTGIFLPLRRLKGRFYRLFSWQSASSGWKNGRTLRALHPLWRLIACSLLWGQVKAHEGHASPTEHPAPPAASGPGLYPREEECAGEARWLVLTLLLGHAIRRPANPDSTTSTGVEGQHVQQGEARDEAKQQEQRAARPEAIGARELKEEEMKQALKRGKEPRSGIEVLLLKPGMTETWPVIAPLGVLKRIGRFALERPQADIFEGGAQ